MHLICWTNDHFIKKHWNFKRNTIFQGADFRNFRKSRFFDFWPLYPVQFFARIFTVATRNWFDEANDGLWPNYIFSKKSNFWFFFFDFGIDFWTGPDRIFFLDRTGPNFSDRLDFWTGPARTGPVHSCTIQDVLEGCLNCHRALHDGVIGWYCAHLPSAITNCPWCLVLARALAT